MLEVTELAQDKLKEHLKEGEQGLAVRVTVTAG